MDEASVTTIDDETRAYPPSLDLCAVDSDESSIGSTTSETHFRSLDEAIDSFALGKYVRSQSNSNKRQRVDDVRTDLRPITFVRFNSRQGKPKPVTLRALLDSGGGGTLVTEKFAKKLRVRHSSAKQVWTTPSGSMTTSSKVRTQFTIPELHDNRVIEWDMHVTKNLGAYDLIIGRDLLQFLGIDVLFSSLTVEWDGASMPFKGQDATVMDSYHVQDPQAVEDRATRVKEILDAKYEPANLEECSKANSELNPEQQRKLLHLLNKHAPLFDGTLGTWKGSMVDLQLKPDAEPYHARPYPIPRVHMDTLKMEVERLCEIGVLKKVNRSEWAAPTFIIPKKDGTVRFISDFRELNKRIRRQPYPIPNIQDMLLNLEGFQYATSLDLNMGYYHIELSP